MAGDEPAAPIIAWFDPRGGAEIAAAPAGFRAEFAARTGLPCNAMATVGKLLWMTGEGLAPTAGTWLNVPEFVASPTRRRDRPPSGPWPAGPDCSTRAPPTCGRPRSICSAPGRA